MNLVSESEHLHESVRAAAERDLSAAEFDALALEIAEFQARWSAGFARLLARHGRPLRGADDVPAVPAAAFRSARVAVHPPELDRARFVTSGTSAAQRGEHVFRTTATYRALATRLGRRALLPAGADRAVVVALAPPPTRPPSSSLGFMMQAFMEELDGRGLAGEAFDSNASSRWLASERGLDVAGLRSAAESAAARREPLIVLATSLSLLALIERKPEALRLPEQSVVMQTGGFKGRVRSADPEDLRRQVARLFEIEPAQVISEYGMTELSSQLYDTGSPGRYRPPPWLRVTAVDPVSLGPVAEGDAGLARFVDLANVDSALAVVTDDLIRVQAGRVELLGRRLDAPARGCSLALESLLLSRAGG